MVLIYASSNPVPLCDVENHVKSISPPRKQAEMLSRELVGMLDSFAKSLAVLKKLPSITPRMWKVQLVIQIIFRAFYCS